MADPTPRPPLLRNWSQPQQQPRQQPTPKIAAPAPSRDLDKIDRNLNRLFKNKAPDDHVKMYLDHEGVSIEEMIAFRNSKSSTPFFDGVGEAIGSAAQIVSNVASKASDFIFPPEDPKFAGTPALIDSDVTTVGAKMTALSDEAYHDVLKKNLGDRYIGTEYDANGAAVIRYRDKSGKETLGYVNQPGPDWQDVDRVITGALPYVAGGLAGRGLTTLAGGAKSAAAVLQSLMAGGVSVGQDVAARQLGSEQPIDYARAGMAGLLGGAAEVVPLPILMGAAGAGVGIAGGDNVEESIAGGIIGGGAGFFGGKGINRALRGPKPNTDPMSPELRARAKAAGFDPDDMTDEQLRQFGAAMNNVTDTTELASAIRTNRFGIPSTRGTRTKDPQLLTIEKDAEHGNLGDEAARIIKQFKEERDRAINYAALGRIVSDPGADPAERGIGTVIAGQRTNPSDLNRFTMGQNIQSGLVKAKTASDDAINAAWDGLDNIYPHQQAFKDLPAAIDSRIGDIAIDPQTMPSAGAMIETLKKFMAGEEAPMGSGLGNPTTRRMDMNFVRRRLLKGYQGASPNNPADVAAAKAVYDGFNDWIDDVAERGLVAGDPANAVKLRTARAITKEIKDLWSPRGKSGKSPAARIIERVTDENIGADRVVSELLGDAGTQAAPKAGTVEALTRIKTALYRFAGPDGTRTWNDIRMAYWSKIVMKPDGTVASPQIMMNNILKSFSKQQGVLRTLYSPDEIRLMKDFGNALKEATYRDPNPSGTATALRAAMREPGFVAGTAKTLLQTQSKRELFSKHNVMMSRIYQILARNIPNTLGARDVVGSAAARRAIDQNMTLRPGPVRGPVGGASASPLIETMRGDLRPDSSLPYGR